METVNQIVKRKNTAFEREESESPTFKPQSVKQLSSPAEMMQGSARKFDNPVEIKMSALDDSSSSSSDEQFVKKSTSDSMKINNFCKFVGKNGGKPALGPNAFKYSRTKESRALSGTGDCIFPEVNTKYSSCKNIATKISST